MAVAAPRPGAGHDGRHAAAQRGGVEDVVVDERRAVDELDGRRRADEPLAVRVVGGEEHEQRPQALAARGDRRARVLGERHAVAGRELRAGAPRRAPAAPGTWSPAARMTSVTGPATATRQAFVPAWIAMIPPAVRIQRMSRRPARAMAAARPSGGGKRRTELGR